MELREPGWSKLRENQALPGEDSAGRATPPPLLSLSAPPLLHPPTHLENIAGRAPKALHVADLDPALGGDRCCYNCYQDTLHPALHVADLNPALGGDKTPNWERLPVGRPA